MVCGRFSSSLQRRCTQLREESAARSDGSIREWSSSFPPPLMQMRAEMEAQLREELAARSGGSSTISEEQLVAMRAEAEEKARAEAQRLQDEAAKMKRRWELRPRGG